MKKIFELHDNLSNYAYPIAKLTISIILYLVLFFRNRLFVLTSEKVSIALTIVTILMIGPIILNIYISVGEIITTYSNRKNSETAICTDITYEQISADIVVDSILTNDIIEFEVLCGKKIIKIGASSDCLNSNDIFFDKFFYIDNQEYNDIEMFRDSLKECINENHLNVISVDGVNPENYNF